jgi:hypothetical protein
VEGDEIKNCHFVYQGVGGFVHTGNKENLIYCTIENGDFIGLIDIVIPKKKLTMLRQMSEDEPYTREEPR